MPVGAAVGLAKLEVEERQSLPASGVSLRPGQGQRHLAGAGGGEPLRCRGAASRSPPGSSDRAGEALPDVRAAGALGHPLPAGQAWAGSRLGEPAAPPRSTRARFPWASSVGGRPVGHRQGTGVDAARGADRGAPARPSGSGTCSTFPPLVGAPPPAPLRRHLGVVPPGVGDLDLVDPLRPQASKETRRGSSFRPATDISCSGPGESPHLAELWPPPCAGRSGGKVALRPSERSSGIVVVLVAELRRRLEEIHRPQSILPGRLRPTTGRADRDGD